MKNKIGFNFVFALLAFPIGLALFREFDVESFTFRKPALGFINLITFIATIVLMLKKNKKSPEQ